MPALLILDGLEVLCPAAAAAVDPGLVEPGGDALTAWLCDTLSALRAPSRTPLPGKMKPSELRSLTEGATQGSSLMLTVRSSMGLRMTSGGCSSSVTNLAVVVVATCGDAAELAQPLRAAGRLDVVVPLPVPGPAQREAILAADLSARGVSLPKSELQVGWCQVYA